MTFVSLPTIPCVTSNFGGVYLCWGCMLNLNSQHPGCCTFEFKIKTQLEVIRQLYVNVVERDIRELCLLDPFVLVWHRLSHFDLTYNENTSVGAIWQSLIIIWIGRRNDHWRFRKPYQKGSYKCSWKYRETQRKYEQLDDVNMLHGKNLVHWVKEEANKDVQLYS